MSSTLPVDEKDAIKNQLKNFHMSFSLSGAQYVSDCDRRQVAKDSKSFSCSTSRGTGNDKELEDEIESLRKFHESFHIQIDGGCKAQTNCQQVNGSSAVQQNNGVTTSNGQLRQAPQSLVLSSPTTHYSNGSNTQKETSPKLERRKKRSKRKKGPPPTGPASFESSYEFTGEILGAGTLSSVATCRNRRSGKEYAVKVVVNSSSYVRMRVLKEVEILYICRNNQNFLQLIDFFETKEKFHLVLEKMKGPLLGLIQQKARFTEREASMVTREAAIALAFLHSRGIAHRDLKPENILCERSDEVTPIKICDFDLSSMVPSKTTPTSTPLLLTPVGSAEYMAPEVVDTFRGDVFAYDKKCDLWSLGVILYMMLSGRPPFHGGCGKRCGWERGEDCEECQSILLEKIRNSNYNFHGKEWNNISQRATQLISQLLEHDVEKRLTAQQVLLHPWISEQAAPETPLATPGLLRRNTSIPDELSLYAATCLRCNRRLSSTCIEEAKPFTLSPPGSSDLALRRTTPQSTATGE